jgi:hypothetical protein
VQGEDDQAERANGPDRANDFDQSDRRERNLGPDRHNNVDQPQRDNESDKS